MSGNMKAHVSLYRAWWFRYLYTPGIVLMCAVGITPDWGRYGKALNRAIRVKAKWEPKE